MAITSEPYDENQRVANSVGKPLPGFQVLNLLMFLKKKINC